MTINRYNLEGRALKKIIKKLFSMLFLAVVFVAFSLPVFVNSPPPADHLTIQFEKLPSDVAYADLLIKFKKNDKNYTELNKDNLNLYGFDENCRIVLYNEDGFESFTFHYEKAKSEIKPDKNSWNREVSFCKGIEYREYLTQYEDLLSNYNRIKLLFWMSMEI